MLSSKYFTLLFINKKIMQENAFSETRLSTLVYKITSYHNEHRSVRVAERLALPTSDHGVAGSNPAGGEILPEPKQRFIAQSLSCSPFHRLEMTEILLKGRKTLTHPYNEHIVKSKQQGNRLVITDTYSFNQSQSIAFDRDKATSPLAEKDTKTVCPNLYQVKFWRSCNMPGNVVRGNQKLCKGNLYRCNWP